MKTMRVKMKISRKMDEMNRKVKKMFKNMNKNTK